jgi:hypothetical protein
MEADHKAKEKIHHPEVKRYGERGLASPGQRVIQKRSQGLFSMSSASEGLPSTLSLEFSHYWKSHL